MSRPRSLRMVMIVRCLCVIQSCTSSRLPFPAGRLPHVWVGDQAKKVSTLDLAPYTQFTLFTGIAGEAWGRPRRRSARSRRPVEVVIIGPGQEYTDLYYDWARAREVEEDGVLLVRPDKHIGWRSMSMPEDPEEALRAALAVAAGTLTPLPGAAGSAWDLRVRKDRGMRFVHDNLPQRVCFGTGEAGPNVQREVGRLGASRVMVIASLRESSLADKISADVPVALRHNDVVMHVPVDVADRAREAAAKEDVDVVVAIGGGIHDGPGQGDRADQRGAHHRRAHTYAGSEATAVWGLTSGDVKTTGTDGQGAAARCHLRCRAHGVAAGGHERGLGG